MKLKPLQLCSLCAPFTVKRRWIALPAALLIALCLPGAIRMIVLSGVLLAGALTGLYTFYTRSRRQRSCLRVPMPQDALCETVLIDASLIGRGTMLRAAAQPVDVADSLSLRLGSGALLLGSAMVLTANTLPTPDKAALYKAVEKLNIVPQRMLRHSPILRTEMNGGVTVVTVRDGVKERRYFMGPAQDVCGLSLRIWEGETRSMTDHDRERILDTAAYIAQGQCRVYTYATALGNEAPTFLGLCGIGEEVEIQALNDIALLRGMGLTVMLDFSSTPDADPDALHTLLDLPGHHAKADIHLSSRDTIQEGALGVMRQRGDSLADPILHLQETFTCTEKALRILALLLGVTLLCGLFSGWWWLPFLSTVMLTAAALLLPVDLDAKLPPVSALIGCVAASAAAWAFLGTTGSAGFGCTVITAVTGLACSMRMGSLHSAARMKERRLPLLILAGILLLAVIAALLASLQTLSLLSSVFTVLMAALCAILTMLK